MKTRHPLELGVRPMTIGDIDAVAGWFDSIDDVSFFDRSAVLPHRGAGEAGGGPADPAARRSSLAAGCARHATIRLPP